MPKAKQDNGATSVAEQYEEDQEKGQEPEAKKGKEKEEKKEKRVIQEPKTPKKAVVVYPELRVIPRFFGSEKGGLTEAEVDAYLGYTTELMAQMKQVKKYPKMKPEDFEWEKDSWLFIDMDNQKVKCRANKHNRPFHSDVAKKYCHDVLEGNWAGPLMLPDEQDEIYNPDGDPYTMADGTVINPGDTISVVNGTVNGETIVIGRYGNVISGQHRMIGFKWACQLWRQQSEKYHAKWPDPPVLECIVVVGVSEDPRVVRTIDNVLPRSLSDVFYTSPIFADLKSVDKKECSTMAQKAVDFLWKRTVPSLFDLVQTHSESVNFVESHGGAKGRLMQGVRFMYALNKTNVISSTLNLSAGQCAGLMYLMGASATDGDKYRQNPCEKSCDWSREDLSEEFWQKAVDNVSSDENEEMFPLEKALKAIVDITEDKARWVEKLVVLSRAWQFVVEGGDLFSVSDETFDQIRLKDDEDYETKKDSDELKLVAESNFGGIDLGSAKPKKEDDPEKTEEEKTKTRQEGRKAIEDAANAFKKKVKEKQEEKENGADPEEESEARKEQRQTRKQVEQQQRDRAADADFVAMWSDWAVEGKLVPAGTSEYDKYKILWIKAGRPNIQEYLANLVRDGNAKPSNDESPKPTRKIKVKASSLKPGNASK